MGAEINISKHVLCIYKVCINNSAGCCWATDEWCASSLWRRWTGRWSWRLWSDEEENTSRRVAPRHLWPGGSLLRVGFYFCVYFGGSGGRRPLLRRWFHRGQWRQRPRLADEEEREAVAAGKNLWQLLSPGPCVSDHRRNKRWAPQNHSWISIFVVRTHR